MATPGRRGLLAAASSVIATLLVTSCASSGHRYVKNSSDGVYFKIPKSWELYDEDAILDFNEEDISPTEADITRQFQWQVFFDADPEPKLGHMNQLVTDHPNGLAQVITLPGSVRDETSLASMRNLLFPIDDVLEQAPSFLQLLREEEINESGFRGIRVVYTIDSRLPQLINGTGELPEKRKLVTFDQTVMVDDATRTLYFLLLSCEAHCYDENETTITDIVDSWTVREV